MFDTDQYCLLDFGDGRKLERFGEVLLDRPSPAAAELSKADPQRWQAAAARFVAAGQSSAGCGQRGRWDVHAALPEFWHVQHPPLTFELRPTEFGHVGVFPEQAENWHWIADRVARLCEKQTERPRVLNLFAYTGGSTLAAAAGGAEVVHIDATRSAVAWARRNAELSGLSAASIRWIVEDARRFVTREQKRGNRYHGIILDPPTYGHGPKGDAWQLERDLPDLLRGCAGLLAENAFLVCTCHSPGVTPGQLARQLSETLSGAKPATIEADDLYLSAEGRRLHSGVAARFSGG